MPTAQCAQQTLRLLDKNWKSFFSAIKDWKNNKNKYLGKPNLPNYKEKNGYYTLVVTNQNAVLENNIIRLPSFQGLAFTPEFIHREDFDSFQQIRFKYDGVNIIAELVYKIKLSEPMKDTGKVASIDIGVDNLATLTFNFDKNPIIYNGKPLKAMNQYYNKHLAKRKSCAGKRNKQKKTKRISKLAKKRNRKINDYLHKASKRIIETLIENNVSTLVIGKNKNWKQKSCLSKYVNQKFVQIPFAKLIDLLKYKAKYVGITVILVNESYTSGTSFLDNEPPTKKYYDKSRRKQRGLFVSNTGRKINADVNGSLQIMKKAIPDAFLRTPWDIGRVLRPLVVVPM